MYHKKVIYKNGHRRQFFFIITVLLIVLTFSNGLLKLYPSPYILNANSQTTKTELDGMIWFFDNNNNKIPITGLFIAPGRIADIVLNETNEAKQNLPMYIMGEDSLPYHFNYDHNIQLGSQWNTDKYLITLEKDKKFYTDVFPEMAKFRFYLSDFKKLDFDVSVNKIYSNGGFDLRVIEHEQG